MPTRKYRTPRVFDQEVQLEGHRFRQLFILDLGHEEPTILLTNQFRASVVSLITRYAQRMLIENSLSDAVRFFHMNALSSAVGLKVTQPHRSLRHMHPAGTDQRGMRKFTGQGKQPPAVCLPTGWVRAWRVQG